MPTSLTRTPLGRPNWGAGAQPERRSTAEINQLAASQAAVRNPTQPAGAPSDLYSNVPVGAVNRFGGRHIGELNRENAQAFGSQLNPRYDESQDPVVAPRPLSFARPAAPVVRSPLTRTPPRTDGLSGFALQNTLNNAGIYAPGSFGAANAAANGTGYTPPPQTERQNPLTGDNNIPMEGQTTMVRAPFVQRGSGTPQGQDSVGGSGLFKRNFASPVSASIYNSYVRRLFPDAPN